MTAVREKNKITEKGYRGEMVQIASRREGNALILLLA